MQKSEILDQIKAKRKELQALKDDIKSRKKDKSLDAADIKEAEDVISEIDEVIDDSGRILSRNSKFADFINWLKRLFGAAKKDGIAGVAAQTTVDIIGVFVNKYLNKNIRKELVNIAFGPKEYKWGRLGVKVSVGLSLKVALNGEAKQGIVVVRGAMGGFAPFAADLTLDLSFTIPFIDKKVESSMGGGLKGELSATVGASVDLHAEGADLKGSLKPIALNTDLDLEVYLTIPQQVFEWWNFAADYSFGKLKPMNDNRLEKKLGKMQLLVVNIPGYDVTFSMKNAAFSGKANGGFSVAPGSDVKALVEKIESYLPWK